MQDRWRLVRGSATHGSGRAPVEQGSASRRPWRTLVVLVSGIAVVAQLGAMGVASGASTAAGTGIPGGGVKPNSVNMLDCNGWSKTYETVRQTAGDLCTDPISYANGKATRFVDNGWYVGHDEPSVKFISSAPGSGNTMSYVMKVSTDPSAAPTSNGKVTDYGQLSVAPWFGLPICDSASYPQNPCKADSDSNTGLNSPTDAGSAFMELQFYPPGFTPFIDAPSCSATKWCAALTIDSLECTFNFASCNNSCIEPVNFAYLQTNGVPAGPPSPQLTDVSTFTPNANTLFINPGDVLAVSISDPRQGFTTKVRDLTTGQAGTMTASAANGFMHTSMADCSGTPYTFHAEYSTAKAQNQVPWAALEGGVLMEQEIGHGEVCSSLTSQDPFTFANNGQSFSDSKIYDTCVNGQDGPGNAGEGPCTAAGICQNATTQGATGPVACPTNDAATGALCEFADGYCLPKGTRTAFVNGVATLESSRANECYENRFQNGDLDYDGSSYLADWPNGSPNTPTTFEYAGPFTARGQIYPTVQFETDAGGSEALCNTATGTDCTAPPISAKFYPFWSLAPGSLGTATGTACLWNFGNDEPNTLSDFGKDAQYGVPDVARYGGTLASPELANPQFARGCTL